MPIVTPEKLASLQRSAESIRNICILAHVDHGKTSLSDALIATNGIISPKQAGKIRYLDSRPDEQERGITMESSAISLYFSMLQRSGDKGEFLINLIDSPGHVDFSSEVSTASRLCDGAVVLVDAVEGVCSQTVTVLRQTWIEKLKPLLVINKMDRLITELKMSAAEANTHLSQLVEQVNAVMGSFVLGERMEYDLNWRETLDQRIAAASNKLQEQVDATPERINGLKHDQDAVDTSTPAEYEEKDDEDIYFAPEKNNVIFSSAIDGWAFTINQFAGIWEKKLGMKRSVLQKVLWGDFYYDPKTKRVLSSKHLKGRNLKPMFVQFVLDSIWQVYEATTGGNSGKGDPSLTEKITKALSITIPAYVLRSRDPRAVLTAVFGAWIPLSTALLVSVIEHLPSPITSQNQRMSDLLDSSPGGGYIDKSLRDAMIDFTQDAAAPAVAYVSKMVAIPESELPHNKRRGGNALSPEEARELARRKRAEFAKARAAEEEQGAGGLVNAMNAAAISDDQDLDAPGEVETQYEPEHLIGFARLYSGTLRVGDEVFVLPPKWNPGNPSASPTPQKVKVEALYLLMGRGLEPLDSVPAGSIFGIGGLAGYVLKNATLSVKSEGAPNLAGVNLGGQPIVRVAVEPENPADLDKMISGLKLLEQSDPCAIYEVLESGEHVLATAGELHLERCLRDLRERYARCEIQAGEAIVPYRESITSAEEMREPRDKALPRGTVVADTPSKQVQVRLRVRPLPQSVIDFLLQNAAAIKKLQLEREEEKSGPAADDAMEPGEVEAGLAQTSLDDAQLAEAGEVIGLDDFRKQLAAAFADVKSDKQVWSGVIERIAAFGPRRSGPNMLIDMTSHGTCEKVLKEDDTLDGDANSNAEIHQRDFADKIVYAFQLATYQGPLCNEPTQGLAVFLEEVNISSEAASSRQHLPRLSGEVIKTVRDCIRTGFLDWSPRILLAMYSCEIQASTEVLGKVYAVITRRRGRIVSEAMKEGTPFFTILSLLPVAESFGFAEEIRKKTSGAASPQLIFAGFEVLEEGDGMGDPFWVPSTEEQLEDLGELADRENLAKKYVDGVRRRKGLFVREKARRAEGQKTLKR